MQIQTKSCTLSETNKKERIKLKSTTENIKDPKKINSK